MKIAAIHLVALISILLRSCSSAQSSGDSDSKNVIDKLYTDCNLKNADLDMNSIKLENLSLGETSKIHQPSEIVQIDLSLKLLDTKQKLKQLIKSVDVQLLNDNNLFYHNGNLFNIGKPLGQGGHSIVYFTTWYHTDYALELITNLLNSKVILEKCNKPVDAVDVALKFCQLSFDTDEEEGRSTLENEEKIRNKIQHENIVSMIDSFKITNTEQGILPGHYLVMQLMESPDLGEIIIANYQNSQSKPPMADVISLCHDMLLALSYIHEQGILHLDVKPGNVYKYQNMWKLNDFSSSIDLKFVDSLPLEQMLGTREFMAPEMLIDLQAAMDRGAILVDNEKNEPEKILTSAMDIWSLGVTLFLFAFGFHPYLEQYEQNISDEMRRSAYIKAAFSVKLTKYSNQMDLDQDLLSFIMKHFLVIKWKKRSTALEILNSPEFKSLALVSNK